MKRSNITELARRANVSAATVSRAMNNHPYVKKDVYDRIMNAAHEMNYMPGNVVRKKRLGIIIEDFDYNMIGAYSGSVLMHLSKYCGMNGWGMEIVPISDLQLLEESFIKVAISMSPRSIGKLKHTRIIPFNWRTEGYPAVLSDYRQEIRIAVEHLFERGCRRPVMCLPGRESPEIINSIGQRKASFLERLGELDLPGGEGTIGYLIEGNPVEVIGKLLKNNQADSLIIAGEDMLYPVNYALDILRYRIPEDISVISYENRMISQYMIPPHTAIAQDFDMLSENAIRLADKVLDGSLEPETKILVPSQLIIRESVKSI
ncbi:MAG: LacI family DNA-binding transcriptional regulator [Victivallaceae bacterium]|jgi:DNA-binding LacI/PurR family transcriptional regulator